MRIRFESPYPLQSKSKKISLENSNKRELEIGNPGLLFSSIMLISLLFQAFHKKKLSHLSFFNSSEGKN